MHRRVTFHTAFPLAVPTKQGWCEQSIIRKKVLELAARTSGAITSKALTKTSTDGMKGTWVSNEVSVSLWIMYLIQLIGLEKTYEACLDDDEISKTIYIHMIFKHY